MKRTKQKINASCSGKKGGCSIPKQPKKEYTKITVKSK